MGFVKDLSRQAAFYSDEAPADPVFTAATQVSINDTEGNFVGGLVEDALAENAERLDGHSQQLADIVDMATVAHVANVFTLPLANKPTKTFKIVSADANTKSVVLSGVNSAEELITVSVLLVCTTACAVTHPTGTTFATGNPTFVTGQSYWIVYESIDGGTTWAGYYVRRS